MQKFFSILFILFFFATFTRAQTNHVALNEFINNPIFKHSSIGVSIKDLSSANAIVYNAEKMLTPASVLKIVTTATALELLGKDYQYTTSLAKDKSNPNRLLIHGYGDPTLGSSVVTKNATDFLPIWADKIIDKFDNQSNLELLIIDNYFGYEGVSQKWLREDVGNYYAPAVYGISIFDNTYQLYLNTVKSDTCPLVVKTVPEMKHLTFTNCLELNTTGKDQGLIVGDPLSYMRTLIGNIPAGRASFVLKGSIPHPGIFLGQVIAEILVASNLKVGNVTTSMEQYNKDAFAKNKTKYEEDIFYIHRSPKLEEILKEVNVKSNNHYAEHLIRTIGRHRNADIYTPALSEGIASIKSFWDSKKINTDALLIHDGSGLSPTNAMSASALTDVLVYMKKDSKNAAAFVRSLPQAGRDGTVRSFLKGSKLAGKIYVKSGSMANVCCYAGYYINDGKEYAFTILVNNFDKPRAEVVKVIEKLLLAIF